MTEPYQKAVIYCRVSDPKQKTEGHGLESQEIRCRHFAVYRRYEVVKAFHDDFTGQTADRPAMKAMLSFLKKQKESYVVIIDDLSRLARDVVAYAQLRQTISATGAIMASPSHEFRENPDGRFQENILASAYQHQREKNAETTLNRMKARSMDGYWVFPAPIGYKFEKVQGHGKLIVRDEPLASLIQEGLEGFASGRFQTQAELMRYFASRSDYPEKRRRTLTIERMTEMLTRVLYAGYITIPDWDLHLVPAKHKPLISFDTYRRIQDRINSAARVPARKDLNHDFPLRQFILCGGCGKPLSGCWSTSRNGSRHPYYLCQNKKDDCPEYGKSIRRDVIEAQFETLLSQLQPSREMFDMAHAMFRDLWDGRMTSAKSRAAALKLELQKVERGIEQFIDRVMVADSSSLVTAYEARIKSLEEEKVAIRENIANCGKPLASFDATFRTAMEFLGNPHKLWLSDRLSDKRAVLKLTFSDRLHYTRNEGFRTASTTSPFRILSTLKGGSEVMVHPTGFEPMALRLGI